MKKYLLLIISILFANLIYAQRSNVIEEELQEVLNHKGDELISVNIIFKNQMPKVNIKDRDVFINELKSFSKRSQADVMSIIKAEERNGKVAEVRNHWLVNAINCELSRDVIYKLSSHPDIAAIAYNKDEYLLWNENSERYEGKGMTQNITHVNADDVWNLGYTGKGVLVGLIDTGVNINHIDLINNLWDGGEEYPNHGYNTYENNHDVEDGFGHGTHCAGTICGDGTSGTQTGIAPDAKIICVKVMDNAGYGSASSISAGMEFAIEHGADVLSMSLGIPNASVAVKEMLRTACVNTLEIGIAAAVAVGNEGQLQISFPAPNNVRVPGGCPPPWIHPDQEINTGGLSCCIAVGAVDYSNIDAPFSSRGPVTWQNTSFGDYPYEPGIGLIRPDVCAPGVGIVSADPYSNNGHVTMEGTSQAAPCVAGIMCLMLEKNPQLTPEQISMILETTAVKLDDNKNNIRGSGLVDALAAIEYIEGGNEVEECEAPTNIVASTVDEYSIALSWNAASTAVSYDIYRNETFIKNVTTTSYNDEELNPATEYCYAVVSVCENGKSDFSNQSCATTDELIIPCDIPTNLNAVVEENLEDNTFNVTLTWDEVENAKSYFVYVNGEEVEETSQPSYIYFTEVEGVVQFAVMTKCETNESDISETITIEIKSQVDLMEYANRFEVYPNPVENTLIIETDYIINEVEICNIVGISIMNLSENFNNIDVTDFSEGVYFIRIRTDKGEVIKRFVKK